jgi:hypothetical protein
MDDDEAVHLVVRGISSYLADHPEAVDTAEGILHWWLPRLRIDATVSAVHCALDRLRAQGTVERRALPDGRHVYGRRHRQTAASTSSDVAVTDAAHSK